MSKNTVPSPILTNNNLKDIDINENLYQNDQLLTLQNTDYCNISNENCVNALRNEMDLSQLSNIPAIPLSLTSAAQTKQIKPQNSLKNLVKSPSISSQNHFLRISTFKPQKSEEEKLKILCENSAKNLEDFEDNLLQI